ncbi:hypothetical protein WA026_021606, partial [Henosepilachna vigintioctopunctata]
MHLSTQKHTDVSSDICAIQSPRIPGMLTAELIVRQLPALHHTMSRAPIACQPPIDMYISGLMAIYCDFLHYRGDLIPVKLREGLQYVDETYKSPRDLLRLNFYLIDYIDIGRKHFNGFNTRYQ